MSTELIVTDLQRLNSGSSAFVELFELEINDTDSIYFSNYQEGPGPLAEGSPTTVDTNLVQFRNYDAPTTINTYYPIPTQLTGIELRTEGQLPQPKLTIANVLKISANNSLPGLLNGVTYDQLLGQKFIRRRTLQKYLYGSAGDANPPVELTRDIYYLDRIENENNLSVTFVLVSPADLTNLTLPRRNVLGNACSWKYQGAGSDLATVDKVGGCSWSTASEVDIGNITTTIYVNEDDEYIYDSTLSYPTWGGGPAAIEGLVSTSETGLTKIQSDGSSLLSQSSTNYWQSAITNNTTTPADDSSDWMRLRVWETYAAGLTINVYTNSKYNTIVLDGGVLWRAISKSQDASAHIATPGYGPYWERADSCGKRLNSCAKRFGVNPVFIMFYDGKSGNFTAGNRILGGTTGDTALIIEANNAATTGNLLLTNITGPFRNNESIREIDDDGGYLTGSAISNGNPPLVATDKASTRTNGKPKLPYGGFPTARVF